MVEMDFDVAIVGTGLAGLTVALNLAARRRVVMLAKRALTEGASDRAQGGIAAVLDSTDSVDDHVRDTLVAGGGLCDEGATRYIVGHSREAVEWLIAQQVPFTRDAQAELGFHLTREGGHSHRRIIHAADATGHAVVETLTGQARRHPNITILEDHQAIDVIVSPGDARRCAGVRVLELSSGRVLTIAARHTVLATGGAGHVYLHTTNPDTATGDGIAMAWRAGCRIANMEFIQFHPTSLFHPLAQSFLISEAVRGEGGQLKLPDGTRFMSLHDAREELAPRDIVARAIDFEIKRHGLDYVHLDISHQSAAFLGEHFPTILARCREFGIDITKEPIPVVPAAHYTCGGVVTDLAGRTDLAGLYAVGETAYTGLHGANRLASNSLLECVVIGRAAVDAIERDGFDAVSAPHADTPAEVRAPANAADTGMVALTRDELRRLMWNYVGIVRTDEGLSRAQRRLAVLRAEIDAQHRHLRVSREALELRNLADVAALVVDSARARRESRGLHYNVDWPDTLPKALPSVLARGLTATQT